VYAECEIKRMAEDEQEKRRKTRDDLESLELHPSSYGAMHGICSLSGAQLLQSPRTLLLPFLFRNPHVVSVGELRSKKWRD